MNKNRRKEIREQIKSLEIIKGKLESILSDEENYFENMPENLQGSMRGEQSEEVIDIMYEVIDTLQSVCESLEEI